MNERGTALIEMLVLSFAVAAVVIPSFVAVARVMDARISVDDTARDAAVWVARHGSDVPVRYENVTLDVRSSSDAVTVVASREVRLIGVGAVNWTVNVESTVQVPVSPYRSGR